MFQDEAGFAAVQLGVDRHRREPRMPDAEHQLDVLGRVLGDDGDAVACGETEPLPQRAGKPRGALCELTVIAVHAPAVPDRRPAAVAFARALEPKRQIQDNSPPLRHPEVRTRRSWVSLEGWSAGVLRGPLRGHLRMMPHTALSQPKCTG